MRKIFWDNPYESRLKTQVVSVDNNRILFAETIAFSFSGGQESDKTCVNGLDVIHSEIDRNVIYY
jgi:Ser-tRNA(Ala) deacylase AlaX